MNRFQHFSEARAAYENVPIPDGLEARVQEGIRQGRAARALRQRRRVRRWACAAACFAALFAGLNLSPAVANAAAGVPVLGRLFRVLTVVRFEKSENGIDYAVDVPAVDAEGDLAKTVNDIIQAKVDLHMEKARQDWQDYQDAFFATGGTEEEWGGRTMDVSVDYEIKSQTDTRVSFVVTMAEGWVASFEERYCYNLDLAEDRPVTLRDLLGEDWVSVSNAAIRRQIEESGDEDGSTYFFTPEQGGFTTVDEGTAFYIREDGLPVAVFPRYSIAAGAAGFPEFPLA